MQVLNFFQKTNGAVIPPIHPTTSTADEPPLTQILRDGTYITLTAELAVRILKECRCKYQRGIRPGRLAYHIGEMKEGRYSEGRQISFCLLDGSLIMVNGYGRLTALTFVSKPIKFMIQIVPVTSMNEVAKEYARHDVGGGERTWKETACEIGEGCDLNPTQLGILLRATQLIMTGFHKPQVNQHATIIYSREKRKAAAAPWRRLAERYFSIISSARGFLRVALQRQPIVACALVTLREVPEEAEKFWAAVASDDGLSRTDPRKLLINRLLERKEGHSVPGQLLAVSAAWNAFYRRRPIKVLAVGRRPFSLAGTSIMPREITDGTNTN